MKLSKNIPLLCLGGMLALCGSGCSLFFGSSAEREVTPANNLAVGSGESLYASPYTPDSIANYRLGREYASAGRYELAREYYLVALAAANDRDLQDALVSELKSIDMMIKSLR